MGSEQLLAPSEPSVIRKEPAASIQVPPEARVLAMGGHLTSSRPGWSSRALGEPVGGRAQQRRGVGARSDRPVRRPLPGGRALRPVPSSYELALDLRGAGIRYVIAPSLSPVRQGGRVKIDRRDARLPALLFQCGQLSSVPVSTVAKEAVRDLCRARADMVVDRTHATAIPLLRVLLTSHHVIRRIVRWGLKVIPGDPKTHNRTG
jgi:hypothetical protein